MYKVYEVIVPIVALALTIMVGCATGRQKSQPNAVADQAAAEPGTETDTAAPNPDDAYQDPKTGKIVTEDGRVLVCRNEKPTGSNLPRKICRWEEDREAAIQKEQDDMRNIMRRSSIITDRKSP
jgi:hypothetical protein